MADRVTQQARIDAVPVAAIAFAAHRPTGQSACRGAASPSGRHSGTTSDGGRPRDRPWDEGVQNRAASVVSVAGVRDYLVNASFTRAQSFFVSIS